MCKASVQSEPMDVIPLVKGCVQNDSMNASQVGPSLTSVMEEEVDVSESCMLRPRDQCTLQSVGLTEMASLFFTLLVDKVVPGGFLWEFALLETSLRCAAARRIRMAARVTDAEAESLLAGEK